MAQLTYEFIIGKLTIELYQALAERDEALARLAEMEASVSPPAEKRPTKGRRPLRLRRG